MSTVFNQHFVDIGRKVQSSINQSDCQMTVTENLRKVDKCMTFNMISEMQICKIVECLKPKASKGPDGLSNVILKKIVHVIKGPLCTIFNRSLQLGVFPDLLKLARVVPIFKGGDSLLADNYHPISLLPVISKVLERIVFVNLTSHLNDNNVLYARQFGFPKGFSAGDAVFNLVGKILKGFEDDYMMLAVFIDLRKAFDSVSHQVILHKLEFLGVRSTELDWFKNYHRSRRQFVDVNGNPLAESPSRQACPRAHCWGFYYFKS